MKFGKRLLAVGLTLSILMTSVLPMTTFAQTTHAEDVYSIENAYLGYSVNTKTGGFHIETFQGHPQKQYDDDMPLLYKDEVDGSVYTSYTTIRVGTGDDAEDYIFGKDYGFWGMSTTLGTPVVADGGRSLALDWTLVDGDTNITVTQAAAISIDDTDQEQGNIALQYAVKNNSGSPVTVSVRVLMDTALGNDVDAPYLTPLSMNSTGEVEVGATILTECAYEGDEIPDQIRGLDSQNNPTKASYLIFDEGVGTNLKPDKLVLAHWANLANTRYDYTPDGYSDFTNYSNQYRIPDAAAALYWEDVVVSGGASMVTNEVFYGVGDFGLGMEDERLGLTGNFDTDVRLNSAGDGYVDSGEFSLTVELDNSVDDARTLTDVKISAIIETSYDLKTLKYVYPIEMPKFPIDEDNLTLISTTASAQVYTYPTLEIGDIKPVTVDFKANVQEVITASSITIGISATAHNSDGTEEFVTYDLDRTVLLPGTGTSTPVTITEVAPKTVYTLGTKNISLGGNMVAFEALDGSDDWNVLLRHESGAETIINKKDLAFTGNYTTAILSTKEELIVGNYSVVFQFTDATLQREFGKEIVTSKTFAVSNDSKYAVRTYGIVALARTADQKYDFFAFDTETAFSNFEDKVKKSSCGATGLFEGATSIDEVLLVVRGAIKEVRDSEEKLTSFTVSTTDGDITINDMLAYVGDTPLTIGVETSGDGTAVRKDYVVRGDGMIQVVGSIDVWGHQWSLSANTSQNYSLRGDGTPIVLSLDGAGQALQSIAGFAVQMKYGELSAEDGTAPVLDKDGKDTGETTEEVAYGISFGGSLSLPVGSKKATSDDEGTTDPATTDTDTTVEDSVRQADTSDVEDMGDTLNDLFCEPGDRTIDQDDISDGISALFREDPAADQKDISDMIQDLFQEAGSTVDQDDISDVLGDLFDETGTLTVDQEELGDLIATLFDEEGLESGTVSDTAGTATTTHTESNITMDSLQVNINDIRYGQDPDDVTDIGFVGIDTTVALGLPEDMLGHVMKNAASVAVTLTVNTLDGYYGVEGGVSVADQFAVEFALMFKEFESSGRTYAAPDKVAFYIRDGLWIPVEPSMSVMITGLGGGIDNLVDSCAGNFEGLPPVSIMVGMNFEILHMIQGQIDGTFGLSGMELVGVIAFNKDASSSNYKQTKEQDTAAQNASPAGPAGSGDVNEVGSVTSSAASGDASVIQITAKVGARWLDPWQISVSGDVSAFMGVLKGGISLTFSDDFQGGYAYCNVCIPDEIPVVGGMEIGGVELAANNSFIGGNVKVIGISYGIIYYWDGNLSFGQDIDLTTTQASMQMLNALTANPFTEPTYTETEDGEPVVAIYGANIKPLAASSVASAPISVMAMSRTASVTNDLNTESVTTNLVDVGTNKQLLLEIPFTGGMKPDVTAVRLTNPEGTVIHLTADDGKGNGNYLVQLSADGTGGIIYISVLDESDVCSGNWTVTVDNPLGIWSLQDIGFNGVATLPELDGVSHIYDSGNPFQLSVTSDISETSSGTGQVSYYLTQDRDILEKMKSQTMTETLGDAIYQSEWDGKSTTSGATITLPDGFTSGDYYVVSTLCLYEGGMSTAISDTAFTFVNPNAPKAVDSAKVIYAGDGEVFVDIDHPDDADYDQVFVEMFTADGGSTGIQGIYSLNDDIYLGKAQTVSTFTGLDEDLNPLGVGETVIPGLEAGVEYIARVSTVKTVDGGNFLYGASVESDSFAIEALDPPKLLNVTSNVCRAGLSNTDTLLVSEEELEITYTFDRPVWMIWSDNGEVTSQGEFKETWSIKQPLVDGQHNIDFTVYGQNKDSATSDDYPNILNAQLGFVVDTVAPILTFTQGVLEDAKVIEATRQVTQDVTTSTNVVYVDDDGDYVVRAICETDAVITVNGAPTTGENLTRTANGSIEYTGNLGAKLTEELVFVATDGAGNQTELVIYAMDGEKSAITQVELHLRQSDGSTEAITDTVVVEEEDSIELVAVSNDGVELDSSIVQWNLLYEKNIVKVDDGTITGLREGETAIKVSVVGGLFTDAEGQQTLAVVEDYAIIQVEPKPEPVEPSPDYTGGSSYHVTLEDTVNGTASLSHTWVMQNTSLTITATPDEGYEVAGVYVNGKYSGNRTLLTIASVTEKLTISVVFAPRWNIPFVDIFTTDWYYDDVRFVYQNGYMVGVSEDHFAPQMDTTRGMLMTVLAREAGVQTEGSNPWYQKGVEWAMAEGVSDGTVPTQPLTREQMVAMLWRYAGSPTPTGDLLDFLDATTVSDWAQQAMIWAVDEGIIKGTTTTTLSPLQSATRAEFSAIFHRFLAR